MHGLAAGCPPSPPFSRGASNGYENTLLVPLPDAEDEVHFFCFLFFVLDYKTKETNLRAKFWLALIS